MSLLSSNRDYAKLLKEKRSKEKNKEKPMTQAEIDEQTKKWCTFYRRNWNIYAKHELGINLYFFQEVLLYLIGVSSVFFEMCSRGLTKSFIASIAGVVQCMLYPQSECILSSKTMKTSKKLVVNKIEMELCQKLSPKLKYLYENKQITFEYNQEEIRVRFLFNNSWILILPEADSSLGERACMLIFEETRIMKQYFVDSVFIPMSRARQAIYLNFPQYQDKNGKPIPELVEPAKTIYLTSTKYKSMWFWDRWKKVVENTFNNNKINYSFFCGDIFTALIHGIKTDEDLMIAKDTMSDIEMRMEYYNEPIGEIEGAFYTLESFKKNSVLYEAFKPPTSMDILTMRDMKNRPKEDGEIRIIFQDFAFKNTTKVGQENDLTVIGCMSGRLNSNGDKLIRSVDYMITLEGSETVKAKLLTRELFIDYEADYIVPDFRNGGEMLFRDELTKPFHHPERHKGEFPTDIDYEEWHGFGICNDPHLQLLSSADLDDFRRYTIDPCALPVIIPFKGEYTINDKCHTVMQSSLRDGKIQFLVDEMELDSYLEDDSKFLTMDSHDKVLLKLPFMETTKLVYEAINLTAKTYKGCIILEESRNATKDRIIACEYGNYIMSLMENKIAKKQGSSSFDIDKYKFLAG